MPGIIAVIERLSLDVVRGLVVAGYGLTSLAIIGATNTTPIVLETSAPHNYLRPTHVIVAGVTGNAAANGINALGVAQGLVATPIDATHVALSAVDEASGYVAPLAGSGAYTGGGTVTHALTDGAILVGHEHIFEQSSPPRIVVVPTGSRFSAKSAYNRRQIGGPPTPELLREWAQRTIATDRILLDVHCWGQSIPPNPARDYDATQVIYQQVIQSTHLLTAGTYELGDGRWPSATDTTSQLVVAGREYVFSIGLGTPVLDRALDFVPSGTAADPTTILQPSDGSPSEVSCTG
jgi:hypothetical protein